MRFEIPTDLFLQLQFIVFDFVLACGCSHVHKKLRLLIVLQDCPKTRDDKIKEGHDDQDIDYA